jgi:hypothetical protein
VIALLVCSLAARTDRATLIGVVVDPPGPVQRTTFGATTIHSSGIGTGAARQFMLCLMF